jgi:transcriptional regulator with XRE-family HTH domain
MITNERQFQMICAQIDRFTAALDAIAAGGLNDSGIDPLLQVVQRDAIVGQIAEMRRDIEDYERLRSGAVSEFHIRSLADLPEVLIRARIAAGFTQKDLALRLGLKEQQVQRYEASRYDGASFARIVEIADTLGLKVDDRVELLRSGSPETLLSRLALLGLSDAFIRRRLVPHFGDSQRSIGVLLDRVKEIFGWEPSQLDAEALLPREIGAALARFKMPRGRDERGAMVYTAYAYHLAKICADAMAEKPRSVIPTGWKEFRAALLSRYERVDLSSTLSFAWDLGIVVLPLRDPGGFHGACWRLRGVNVVVLKQLTAYPARWLFDLIHEIFHCGQNPDQPEFTWIEESELSEERRTSLEERHAMWFAGQVGLDGRAEELAGLAMQRANNGFLPKLKQSVFDLASEQEIDRSFLANYLAYRLSLQNENWWGAAANLQERDCDPFEVARNIFFERFDFSKLDSANVDLLGLALDDEGSDG